MKLLILKGLSLFGSVNNQFPEQKFDFEVIKRKHKNLIDIITYDDLLQRLRFIIEQKKN